MPNIRRHTLLNIGFALALTTTIITATGSAAASQQETLLSDYAQQAATATPGFQSFSAARGEELFRTEYAQGKPETPACTTCHSTSPHQTGETRAGKPIEPLAISKTPNRFTDPEKVEKWFRRNCNSVLGRECTPLEKGDFISFMLTQ